MTVLKYVETLWFYGSNFVLLPCVIAIATWYVLLPEQQQICIDDYANGGRLLCRPKCRKGYFGLPDMETCKKFLGCKDFKNITEKWMIGQGAVKEVYLSSWRTHTIVLNKLRFNMYRDDFEHGHKMLKSFAPSPYTVQYLGACGDSYLTEFHRHGSLLSINSLLEVDVFRDYDSRKTRFSLSIRYVEILEFLHNSPLGTRVMCDSNDINKTLSQYLVTEDLSFVVNDVDALPMVNHTKNIKIKCGHKELSGDFVAPEQQWPYQDEEFDDKKMPGYDEKIDIWRVPDVFKYLIDDIPNGESLKYHLFEIHNQCKNRNPAKRPNARDILNQYRSVWNRFKFDLKT